MVYVTSPLRESGLPAARFAHRRLELALKEVHRPEETYGRRCRLPPLLCIGCCCLLRRELPFPAGAPSRSSMCAGGAWEVRPERMLQRRGTHCAPLLRRVQHQRQRKPERHLHTVAQSSNFVSSCLGSAGYEDAHEQGSLRAAQHIWLPVCAALTCAPLCLDSVSMLHRRDCLPEGSILCSCRWHAVISRAATLPSAHLVIGDGRRG